MKRPIARIGLDVYLQAKRDGAAAKRILSVHAAVSIQFWQGT